MGEFQPLATTFSIGKVLIWCFYPMLTLAAIELIFRGFDDDDEQGGGMMIPVYQGVKE